MAHDDGLTDDERRLERRRSRLGVLGVALFVGGPVLGAALVVVGVVVALREDPRWALVAVLGLGIVFGVTFAGLRLLTRLEAARSAIAATDADSSTAARFGGPEEPEAPEWAERPERAEQPDDAADAQSDPASPGRTSPDS
ncbi:hypothetical protein [Agromyces bracchium]|uniref:Uncharacterized protein n=1 Tax=Agromyces bracchium TaxID=88376 RepID=A0A6I3M4X8_9MICO|nr:hypothetical protein [Agromyces bracchium]MTH67187.1 hypothetical protein [Agromyces bracchium]